MPHDRPVATAGISLLCVLLALIPGTWQQALAYDRQAIAAGELWRLWSGHLVHFSAHHAVINAAALLLLGIAVEAAWGNRRTLQAILFCALAISGGLWLVAPDVLEYRGASGLATLFAVLAGLQYWKTQPAFRGVLALCACLLTLKSVLDASGASSSLARLPDDVTVCWQAHLLGALAGFGLASGNRSRNGVQLVNCSIRAASASMRSALARSLTAFSTK